MARKRKRSKKWISWLIMLILLVAACVMVYLVWDNYFRDDMKKGGEEPEPAEVVDNKTEDDTTEDQKPEEKEEIVQYEGENPNNAGELTGVVTYAGVTGEKLVIRVNINQYLSGGSCSLRLVFEDDVAVLEETAQIVDSASTSTCEGFDIPTAGLQSGNYRIYIGLTSGGKTGMINGEVRL